MHGGRGVGKTTVPANDDVNDLGSGGERLFPEGIECMSPPLRVDGEHHAFAAVTRLSAVEPEWFPRWDSEFDDLLHRMIGVDWFETRIKAIEMTMPIGQLHAWLVE